MGSLDRKSVQGYLDIHCFAGGNGSLEYYEDDGDSNQYRDGKYVTTPIVFNSDNQTLLVKIGESGGEFPSMIVDYCFNIIVHGVKSVSAVKVNGHDMIEYSHDTVTNVVRMGIKKSKFENMSVEIFQ
jgi:alpha-glucosidase (family GH31 glycosyl hydrolase)